MIKSSKPVYSPLYNTMDFELWGRQVAPVDQKGKMFP